MIIISVSHGSQASWQCCSIYKIFSLLNHMHHTTQIKSPISTMPQSEDKSQVHNRSFFLGQESWWHLAVCKVTKLNNIIFFVFRLANSYFHAVLLTMSSSPYILHVIIYMYAVLIMWFMSSAPIELLHVEVLHQVLVKLLEW